MLVGYVGGVDVFESGEEGGEVRAAAWAVGGGVGIGGGDVVLDWRRVVGSVVAVKGEKGDV